FAGDQTLLKCRPNPRIMNTHVVSVEGGDVCFEIVDFQNDPSQIKRDADSTMSLIREQSQHLKKNVDDYNSGLRRQAESFFDARKAEIMKQNDLVAALGVPVKRPEN